MNRLFRRISASATCLLLLLVSIAYIAAPVPARAEPVPPGPYRIGAGFTPPVNQPPVEFDVPSVGFWSDELTWNKDTEEISWGTLTYDWEEIEEIAQLDSIQPSGDYLVGSIEHVLSRWHKWRVKPKNSADWAKMSASARAKKWGTWLKTYGTSTSNGLQGTGFELLVGQVQGYTAQGFEHDTKVSENIDERPDFGLRTGPESYSHLVEVKSGAWTMEQIRSRFELAVQTGATKLDVYFSKRPGKKRIAELERLAAEYPGVESRLFVYPAKARKIVNPSTYENPPDGSGSGAAPPSGPGPTSPPGSLVAGGQNGAESPSTDAFSGSPASPEEAAETSEMTEQLAQDSGYNSSGDAEMTSDQLGGVDFSTLELRYVSDTYDGGLGTGVDYAYSVDAAEGVDVSYGGRESAQLAADAFFTWLALPTDTFWVNLNPDEPDRIIDEDFGSTDAGRVLLEADLDMKKIVADFIHPDTKGGAKYWEALRGETKCISMRQWIVPKPAVVKDDGDSLFILDAPLEVKMEGEYLESKGAGGTAGCSGQSGGDTDHNEGVYADLILPKVEEAVNTAPEFAELRRVYASRVAAEWYRHRSETKTTAYSDIIDSGDVSAWPAREDWDPKDVFDDYVKSYTEGEFNVERRTRQGDYIVTTTYIYGGVTFFDVPSRSVSDEEFAAEHPALNAAVGESMLAPTVEEGAAGIWLGGRSTERPLWDPLPPPPTPLGNPFFWVLSTLPVAGWLAVGVFLWRRKTKATTPPTFAGTSGPVTR
ncbi:hypothetical protein [Phytomonospora endophytica]|uniref:Uncharacterized protein n=1 Tax=Phytomonospora endophytica TaxID=714109 RepID=A0A841FGH3_9ACTN|nr:hypothetical protein [Phytomonospora endophytica]MBB6032652.1 hypothetical protein [Phytomonospora endophytica]GIG66198.1 hypothetical protein Pen01_24930 [Phytomonospora endophytica]